MIKTVFAMLVLSLPAWTQATVKDALVKHWKVTGDFTIAVARLMPAEHYGFRPVAEELSFGQLMVQIAGANINACSNASGLARMEIPAPILQAVKDEQKNVDKELALQFLSDSFDYCNRAVAAMTPEKLDALVGGNRKMTGFEWLWAYFTHTAHHRGQAEVYLRVKGIKPPDYVF